jgi:xanthine dehydrogenase YagT iron-sulfur-binding subunit
MKTYEDEILGCRPGELGPGHMPDRSPTVSGALPVKRRTVVQAGAALATAQLTGCATTPEPQLAGFIDPPMPERPPTMMPVSLNVNGRNVRVTVDTRTTVLDVLRENLALKGSKKGCDHGQCGACTVLIDGRRTNACLSLAVMHDGQEITTIEGVGTPERLHPMQAAFLHRDGFQCGYCTPGQICSSIGMLAEVKLGMPSHVTKDLQASSALSDEEIRERMSGNLCRCSAYPRIVEAIRDVAQGQTS